MDYPARGYVNLTVLRTPLVRVTRRATRLAISNERWNVLMVTLVLVGTAGVVGFGAWLALRRWPLLDPGAPKGAVHAVAEEVREAIEDAGPLERRFIHRRMDPAAATGLGLTVATAVIVVGGGILAGLAVLVRSWSVLESIDRGAANWGATNATDFSTGLVRTVTHLGGTVAVVAMALMVVALNVRSRQRNAVIGFLVVLVVGQNLIANLVKLLVDRARPDGLALAGFSGPSFPSGHTTAAFAVFAGFALILSRGKGRRVQAIAMGVAMGTAAAVAATRVLLDVHWLTDVIGGVALGLAWFGVSAIAFGGRLLKFGAPVEAGERAATLDAIAQHPTAQSTAAHPTPAQPAPAPTAAGPDVSGSPGSGTI